MSFFMCSSDFILIYKYYTSKVSLFSSNRFRVSFFPSKSFLGVTFLSKSFHRWCHFFRQIVSRVSDYIHSIRKICINASPWYFTNYFLTHQTSPPYNTPVSSIFDSHFRRLQTAFCSEHKRVCTLLSCESCRDEPPTMRFCTYRSRIFSSFS